MRAPGNFSVVFFARGGSIDATKRRTIWWSKKQRRGAVIPSQTDKSTSAFANARLALRHSRAPLTKRLCNLGRIQGIVNASAMLKVKDTLRATVHLSFDGRVQGLSHITARMR